MKYILVLISIVISGISHAQKTPFSIHKNRIKTESNYLIEIPELNKLQLLNEDSNELIKNKHTAPRFAVSHTVNLSSESFGKWFYNKYNDLVWEVKVNSVNSQSLSLIFNDFSIGTNGSVSILDENKNLLLGPYIEDNSFNNKLSTPPVK